MRRSWERALLVGTLAAALLVGCGDDGDEAVPASSTVGSTTSTEPADPFAVPEVIDEAYVHRVLTEIFRIQGDALRVAVERGEVLPDTVETLRAVYGDEEAAFVANEYLDVARDQFTSLLLPPGDIRILDLSVSSSASDCIVARATLNYAEVARQGAPRLEGVLVLHRDDLARVGWRIMDTGPDSGSTSGTTC